MPNNEPKRKFESLAQMVSTMRESLGMSQSGLAKKCNLTVEQIENIPTINKTSWNNEITAIIA